MLDVSKYYFVDYNGGTVMYLERLKHSYAKRVSTATPAELTLINMELALAFIKNNDLDRARKAICLLAEALDFRYELSQSLYNIYTIIDRKLNAGIVNNDSTAVDDAKYLIRQLSEGWKDTASAQTNPIISQQKPKITIGLTYDATGPCSYIEQDYSGGYRA